MPKDFLKDARSRYDVVVIGSGLAGLTAANVLARAGRSVLLLEQHYKLGGMATWFKRPGGHIFDISLHGFPVGMIKSCRRYWTKEIADSIVQLKGIRFENPQFSLFAQPEQVWFGNLVDTVEYTDSELTEFSSQDRFLTRFTTGIAYRPTPLVVFSLAYEYTLTNSGKSLGSVTNYFATNANHANSFLAGVAFGF